MTRLGYCDPQRGHAARPVADVVGGIAARADGVPVEHGAHGRHADAVAMTQRESPVPRACSAGLLRRGCDQQTTVTAFGAVSEGLGAGPRRPGHRSRSKARPWPRGRQIKARRFAFSGNGRVTSRAVLPANMQVARAGRCTCRAVHRRTDHVLISTTTPAAHPHAGAGAEPLQSRVSGRSFGSCNSEAMSVFWWCQDHQRGSHRETRFRCRSSAGTDDERRSGSLAWLDDGTS
jgi:hypothetical protein